MKLFVALVLLSPLSSLASAFDHGPFDAVLKKYVDRSGMVDYAALKSDRGTLDTYLKKTGSVPEPEFNGWSGPERLAFLINVYNAETLQFIIDNYPVSSIRKLGGLLSSAWDKKTVVLFGKETTLDHLEHGIIRVKYSEPRIHLLSSALRKAVLLCGGRRLRQGSSTPSLRIKPGIFSPKLPKTVSKGIRSFFPPSLTGMKRTSLERERR